MSDRAKDVSVPVGSGLRNLLLCGLGGLFMGLLLCWVFVARPLQARLDQSEQSRRDWERVNQIERESIGSMKTVSAEEMRKWVSTVDEQNVRYVELSQQMHQQELELTGPDYAYLAICVVALLGVTGFAVWMVRDSNAESARTLRAAVAVLPALQETLDSGDVRQNHSELIAKTSTASEEKPLLDGRTLDTEK